MNAALRKATLGGARLTPSDVIALALSVAGFPVRRTGAVVRLILQGLAQSGFEIRRVQASSDGAEA